MIEHIIYNPDELIRGAYDLNGVWWFEEDIIKFSSFIIKISFNKNRNDIEIVEIKRHQAWRQNKFKRNLF